MPTRANKTSDLPKNNTVPSTDTITNIVFGLCAVMVGTITVWQGRKLLRTWYARHVDEIEVYDGTVHLIDEMPR